jgi:hypothetical protein
MLKQYATIAALSVAALAAAPQAQAHDNGSSIHCRRLDRACGRCRDREPAGRVCAAARCVLSSSACRLLSSVASGVLRTTSSTSCLLRAAEVSLQAWLARAPGLGRLAAAFGPP